MSMTDQRSYFTFLTQRSSPNSEVMVFEAARLQSFAQWMSYDRASPVALAKAGFFYTGTQDVVQCCVCSTRKGDWEINMKPMETHMSLNPNCGYVKGGVNIPICVPEARVYREIIENLHRQYCDVNSPVVNSFEETRGFVDNSTAPFLQNQPAATQTNFPEVATDAGTAETSRQAIGVRGALGRGHESEAAPTREEFAPMKQEANRFASFDTNWPTQETPDPRDLARAGFYYTGTVDRVQCTFCRGILRNWEEDDVPMEEHRRHFPMCPFVMSLDVGNIVDPTAVITANTSRNVINIPDAVSVVSDSSMGIVTERPKHSQYAVEAARLASFRNWSRSKEQTPELLAKAGFFYAGFGDSVKCFFCDGGLRTWERGDVPWIEHARWFPCCPYVKQVKGEDFIRAAMEGRDPSLTVSTTHDDSVAGSSEHLNGGSTSSQNQQINSARTETEDMNVDENDPASLLEENAHLKEQRLCKICMDAEVSVVFLPCGHLVSCAACAPALRRCPICRSEVRGTVRTYMS